MSEKPTYEELELRIKALERAQSELKQVEEELRKSEKHIQSVFRSAPVGIGVVVNRVFRQINDRLCEMTGYRPGEMIGQSSRMLYLTDEDSDYVGREKYAQIQDHGTGTVETRWKCKDGKIITVLLSSTPIELDDLSEGVTFTALDITERKQAEAERERLQSQLYQAQKMESVGRLAGGVAHDFNNMLNIIIGHVDMILDDLPPDSHLRADLEEVQTAAHHSADITRQLLAYARKQTIAPIVLDLNQTVESMLKMLRHLIGENISLFWQPGSGLWPVKMDPSQIDQILANLCVNASDAIDGVGKLIIETDKVVLDEEYCASHTGFVPGEFVMLSVSDNGQGMDEVVRKNIFEPFFTTKEVGKGTGLGLAMIYGIVKQNKGFINVYSEPAQGTSISIYLPRYTEKSALEQKKDAPETPARGSETILLVEDEPAILRMAREMLERQGYTVLSASAPEVAIRLSREYSEDIQLLITDVVMPEMNGWDLAKKLSSIYPGIRHLFMSGYPTSMITDGGLLNEGVHYIQKPFSSIELTSKVRKVLDEQDTSN